LTARKRFFLAKFGGIQRFSLLSDGTHHYENLSYPLFDLIPYSKEIIADPA